MRGTNAKDMRIGKLFAPPVRSIPNIPNVRRPTLLLSPFLGLAILLTLSFGCGPPSSQADGQQSPSGSIQGDTPELSDETIRERINDAYVREVPEQNGAAEPITWSFDESEPKEISVVDKQIEGNRATIVLDIKTSSAPRARNQRYLAGQIRTIWKLETGWVLRRWKIDGTENISMKYKKIPDPNAENKQPSNNSAPNSR
ncbi:MAG: hypothetical protein ABJB34_06270 [Acidobacteriota bacterium]